MKIMEITESINSQPNSYSLSKDVEETMNEYRAGKLNSDAALERLETLDDLIKDVYENDSYWKQFSMDNYKDVVSGWEELELRVEKYKNEVTYGGTPNTNTTTFHEDSSTIVQDVHRSKPTKNQTKAKQKVEALFKDKQ
jgi:hypothetical protein